MFSECEGSSNDRFLDQNFVTGYDSDGNELQIKCKCGKKATFFCIGKESVQGFCRDCSSFETLKGKT